jgi:hypothetical protein
MKILFDRGNEKIFIEQKKNKVELLYLVFVQKISKNRSRVFIHVKYQMILKH